MRSKSSHFTSVLVCLVPDSASNLSASGQDAVGSWEQAEGNSNQEEKLPVIYVTDRGEVEELPGYRSGGFFAKIFPNYIRDLQISTQTSPAAYPPSLLLCPFIMRQQRERVFPPGFWGKSSIRLPEHGHCAVFCL